VILLDDAEWLTEQLHQRMPTESEIADQRALELTANQAVQALLQQRINWTWKVAAGISRRGCVQTIAGSQNRHAHRSVVVTSFLTRESPADDVLARLWCMDLRAEVVIDAPAHAAWAVLGERFGQISDWAAPIETSSLEGEPAVGAIRTCQFVGFGPFKSGTIKERLVEFDPPTMSLAYEGAEGMPRFVKRAINRWTVHSQTEGSCSVRTHATLELRGPLRLIQFLLKRRLQADGARVLGELRYQIECGRPHPRKLAAA
jgi:hypothetical protein